MTGFFKKKNPSDNIVLFLYALALRWYSITHAQQPKFSGGDGLLYRYFIHSFSWFQFSSLFFSLIAFSLVFSQSLVLNALVNRQKLISKDNHLTAMVFILLSSLLPDWQMISAPLLANSLLVWALSLLVKAAGHTRSKTMLFNAGMIFGLSIMVYLPSILFSFVFFPAILILRPFIIREWILGVLGILTPYYFLCSFRFLKGHSLFGDWGTFQFHWPSWDLNLNSALPFFSIAVLFVLGIYFGQKHMQRHVVQTRRSWSIVYIYFLVSLLMAIAVKMEHGVGFINSLGPISIIGSCFFYYPSSKWVTNIMHWLVFVVAIKLQYFP